MQINYMIFHKKEILFQRPIKSYVNTSRQYTHIWGALCCPYTPGSPQSFSGSKRWGDGCEPQNHLAEEKGGFSGSNPPV